MSIELFRLLLLAAFQECVSSAILTSPTPSITPPPLLPRAQTVIGYQSTGEEHGTTLWDTISLEEGLVVQTSGDLWQLCEPSLCEFFTCSGDYEVYSFTSFYCGTASSSTCSYHILATGISDRDPLTAYWCTDIDSSTGMTIYETTPEEITSDTSTVSSTPTPIHLPPDPPPGRKRPIGAIVGGVIGGIASLAAIIFAIITILRKRRPIQPIQQHYQEQQPAAAFQQMPPPNILQDYNSSKPQYQYPVLEKAPHSTMAHVNYYPEAMSGPASPTSPAPQYVHTPAPPDMNELSAQRMD